MKRLFFFLLFSISLPTLACDICGCGVGNAYYGIMPQSYRNFIGVRYRYRTYDSHLNSQLLRTKETFQTTELWGRFYPTQRIQMLAFVPYNFNFQQDAATSARLNGLGDMTILANYNVLNTNMDTLDRAFNHTLLLGGGIKLATGRSNFRDDGSLGANANFQLGTGSTDFLVNALYTLRYKSWGWNSDVSYRISTTNPDHYRFGNRLSGSTSAFYVTSAGKNLTLMPNVGVTAEYSAEDRKNGVRNSQTGGYATLATAGVETYFGKFVAGVNFQQPLAQNLAKGDSKAQQRLQVHFTVLL